MQVGSGKKSQLGISNYKSKDSKYYQTIKTEKTPETNKIPVTTSILAPSKLFINNIYNDYKNLLLKIYLYNENNESKNKYNDLLKLTNINNKFIKNYELIEDKFIKNNIKIISNIINNIQKKEECIINMQQKTKIDKYDGRDFFNEEEITNINNLRKLCETFPQKIYISNNNNIHDFLLFFLNNDNYDNMLKEYIFDNFRKYYGREIRRYWEVNYKESYAKNIILRKKFINFKFIPYLNIKIKQFQNEMIEQLNMFNVFIDNFLKFNNSFYKQYINNNEIMTKIDYNLFIDKIDEYKEHIEKHIEYSDNNDFKIYFKFLLELSNYLKEDLYLLNKLDIKFNDQKSMFKILDIYRNYIKNKKVYPINEIINLLSS